MKPLRFLLTGGFYGLSDVSVKLLQMAALLWLAKICTKQEYGNFGILISVQQIITLLALGGNIETMSSMLNRFRVKNRLSTLFSSVMQVTNISSVIISICFILICLYMLKTNIAFGSIKVYILALLCGLLIARFMLMTSIFQLQERHGMAILFKTVPFFLAYLLGYVIAKINNDHISGYYEGVLSGLLIFIFVKSFVIKAAKSKFHKKIIMIFYKKSLPFLGIVVIGWMSGMGMNMILKILFSNKEIAEYTMINNFNAVLLLTISMLSNVWNPRFYLIAAKFPEGYLNRANNKVFQVQLLILSTISALMLLYFKDILGLLGGNLLGYGEIHPYLLISYSSYIFLILYYQSVSYYLLHNRGALIFKINLITGVIGTLAWVLFMLLVGTWGIYLGFAVQMVMRGGVIFWYAFKEWGVRVSISNLLSGFLILFAAYFISNSAMGIVMRTAGFFSLLLAVASVYWIIHRRKFADYLEYIS
ncbi:lipopolysaccharide biosynthesis protein [Candidatus Magnetominusculus dajiuhuensis]|uniref:lipopolysaccharide biosynthesis protein n=1 Tax=Candidatus Magnetominusculus dajiuhuensis TaxID=3137712 RepID=UPI003B42CB36